MPLSPPRLQLRGSCGALNGAPWVTNLQQRLQQGEANLADDAKRSSSMGEQHARARPLKAGRTAPGRVSQAWSQKPAIRAVVNRQQTQAHKGYPSGTHDQRSDLCLLFVQDVGVGWPCSQGLVPMSERQAPVTRLGCLVASLLRGHRVRD